MLAAPQTRWRGLPGCRHASASTSGISAPLIWDAPLCAQSARKGRAVWDHWDAPLPVNLPKSHDELERQIADASDEYQQQHRETQNIISAACVLTSGSRVLLSGTRVLTCETRVLISATRVIINENRALIHTTRAFRSGARALINTTRVLTVFYIVVHMSDQPTQCPKARRGLCPCNHIYMTKTYLYDKIIFICQSRSSCCCSGSSS